MKSDHLSLKSRTPFALYTSRHEKIPGARNLLNDRVFDVACLTLLDGMALSESPTFW
jgi:hypothetical protein